MTNEFRLETARLVLRRFQLADANHYFELNAVPEVCWLDAEQWQARLPGRLLMTLKDGTPVGIAGLRYLPSLRCIDVGYRVLAAQQGKGFAREALVALLSFARHQPEWPDVIALIHADNHASQALAQRAGLTYRGEVFVDEFGFALGRYQ